MGVILTMTMMMMTALAMTRERERGTMENLLATPVRPFEVMVGKIVPYILIGYVQVVVILAAAQLLFEVPMVGSLALLSSILVLFIAANLAVGFTFSTLARNQLQAMQMTFFFFLPSMLLSGFMFPFRGMPGWAQAIGRGPAAHAFPADRARHHAQGEPMGRHRPRSGGARGVPRRRRGHRARPLPRNPRLSGPRARKSLFRFDTIRVFPAPRPPIP